MFPLRWQPTQREWVAAQHLFPAQVYLVTKDTPRALWTLPRQEVFCFVLMSFEIPQSSPDRWASRGKLQGRGVGKPCFVVVQCNHNQGGLMKTRGDRFMSTQSAAQQKSKQNVPDFFEVLSCRYANSVSLSWFKYPVNVDDTKMAN